MKHYLIFDVNKPIMSDNITMQGNSNADAVRKYVKQYYPGKKIKCSACNFVQLSAQECRIEDGKIYRLGWKRTTWFKFI